MEGCCYCLSRWEINVRYKYNNVSKSQVVRIFFMRHKIELISKVRGKHPMNHTALTALQVQYKRFIDSKMFMFLTSLTVLSIQLTTLNIKNNGMTRLLKLF